MLRPWALLVLLVAAPGCADPADALQLSAEVSDTIPTVISVEGSIAHEAPDAVRVEVLQGEEWQPTPLALDEDGRFSRPLLGFKPGTEVEIRLAAILDGEPLVSPGQVVTTGPIDGYLPHLEAEVLTPDAAPDGYLVTTMISFPSSAVILDRDGQYVWWYRLEDDEVPMTRARLSRDGQSMLFLAAELAFGEDANTETDQPLVRVSLDGTQVVKTGIPGAHHDFVELPDGTIGAIAHDLREVDEAYVRGDRILELSPDGSIKEVWSVWDHIPYNQGQITDPGTGWTHANALDYDPQSDTYTVSLRNFSCLIRIQRATGEVVWTLGSPESDFADAGGSYKYFEHQHQFQFLDDRVLVFDNGTDEDAGSRVVEIALDEETGLGEEVWSHVADPPLYTFALGDVERLDGGETYVTWSTSGQIDLLDPYGERVWRLNAGVPGSFGYVEWRPDLP